MLRFLAFLVLSSAVLAADPEPQKAASLTKDSVWKVRRVLEDLTYPVKTAALRDSIRNAAGPLSWTHGYEGGGRCFNYWALGEAEGGFFELEFEHPYFRPEGKNADWPDEDSVIRARLTFWSDIGGRTYFPDLCDQSADFPKEKSRANQRPDGTSAKAPPSNPSQGAAVPHP